MVAFVFEFERQGLFFVHLDEPEIQVILNVYCLFLVSGRKLDGLGEAFGFYQKRVFQVLGLLGGEVHHCFDRETRGEVGDAGVVDSEVGGPGLEDQEALGGLG